MSKDAYLIFRVSIAEPTQARWLRNCLLIIGLGEPTSTPFAQGVPVYFHLWPALLNQIIDLQDPRIFHYLMKSAEGQHP